MKKCNGTGLVLKICETKNNVWKKHERYPVENEVILAYEVMEKELNKASTDICYDGRRFIPRMNSKNGEVNEQTIFTYHHMNQAMQVKTGKCHSVPTVLEDGKIELSEKWKWTSGNYSEGESLLVEV